jgi:predicted DNA-binding transcriptional regulator AlpA
MADMGLSRDTTARQLAGLTDGRRLRTPEAAEYLGIGESTLEKWRCSGQGPMFERSGTRIVVYRVADLEEFLAARRARSTSELPIRNTTPAPLAVQKGLGRRPARRVSAEPAE